MNELLCVTYRLMIVTCKVVFGKGTEKHYNSFMKKLKAARLLLQIKYDLKNSKLVNSD